MLTPLLSTTPGELPTYTPSIADTFSWVPVQGANRPLFARATYDVTTESTLGQSGFVFLENNESAWGEFSTIFVLSAAKISALSANNSFVGNLTNYELSQNFTLYGPIQGITLSYGAVIAYKL